MAPEHFTKATVAASFWCAKCAKPTFHRVDNGRRGPCHECMQKLEAERLKPKPPPPAQQEDLFS
jgi:hypothetical protein